MLLLLVARLEFTDDELHDANGFGTYQPQHDHHHAQAMVEVTKCQLPVAGSSEGTR